MSPVSVMVIAAVPVAAPPVVSTIVVLVAVAAGDEKEGRDIPNRMTRVTVNTISTAQEPELKTFIYTLVQRGVVLRFD